LLCDRYGRRLLVYDKKAIGGSVMDIRLADVLVMKKPHPCGEKRWKVLRTGADFRLKCLGCGHEVMTPRFKAEKNIRQVIREDDLTTESSGS